MTCIDCAALPAAEKPKKPRKVAEGAERCASHQRAFDAATRARALEHACIDCRALPEKPLTWGGLGDGPADQFRPATPRPAPHGGALSKRCATHYREHRKARRQRAHDASVVRIYGLEAGEYERLLAHQGGTCAIPGCRASGKARRLAVDHDHETGEVRGLLCSPHNYDLLGKFKNDLQHGLDYLADPPARRMRAAQLKDAS